jgi:Berberine and berberine like
VTSPEGHPVVAFIICYSGSIEKGEEVVRPLRAFGSPVADMVGPMPYTAVQALGGPLYPPGRFNYWKSSFVYDLSDAAIDTMIAQFEAVPSPFSVAALEHLGGAMSRIGKEETAFNERTAPFSLIITSEWTDPAESEKNIQGARDFWEAMRPFESEAAYVNYLGSEGEDRVKAAYGPAHYARLVALKNKYDPTNLFRLNQNIKPSV